MTKDSEPNGSKHSLYKSDKFQPPTSSISGLKTCKRRLHFPFRTPRSKTFLGFGFFPLVWAVPLQVCQVSAFYLIQKWVIFLWKENAYTYFLYMEETLVYRPKSACCHISIKTVRYIQPNCIRICLLLITKAFSNKIIRSTVCSHINHVDGRLTKDLRLKTAL
jgi:hypothetical protein